MPINTPTVKNRFTPSERCPTAHGKGQAQQQFKKYCDLNHIMAQFDKTGLINHNAKTPGEYAYVPATSLHEAMNLVTAAQTQFNELPPQLRSKFQNDPRVLMEFIEDENNRSEAEELGLLNPRDPLGSPEPSGTAKSDETGAVTGSDPGTPPAVPEDQQ